MTYPERSNNNGEFESRESEKQACEYLIDPTVLKVFDFDGTISATDSLQKKSSDNTFKEMGIDDINITPELAASFRGKSDEEIYALILGEERSHLISTAIETRAHQLITLAEHEENPKELLLPGVEDIIRVLRTTGQQAGIASASPDEFINELLRKTEIDGEPIDDVFPVGKVVGSTSVERATDLYTPEDAILTKPHPYSIIIGAQNMHAPVSRPVMYVGDSTVDYNAMTVFPSPVHGVVVGRKAAELQSNDDSDVEITFTPSLAQIVQHVDWDALTPDNAEYEQFSRLNTFHQN